MTIARSISSRRHLFPRAFFVVAFAAVLTPAAPAAAIDNEDGSHQRPTLWAPSDIQAEMGYEEWGNVAIYFSWNLSQSPRSLNNYIAGGPAESFELGWKKTGWAACRTNHAINNSAGFPNGVYRGVDFTEDPGDAVAFIADMDKVAWDYRANPVLLKYAISWTCHSNAGFAPDESTYFHTQQGSTDRPLTSASIGQLDYINEEVHTASGFRGFPATNPGDPLLAASRMRSPWLRSSSFETGFDTWATQNAGGAGLAPVKAVIWCGAARSGKCYARMTGGPGWLFQHSDNQNYSFDEGFPGWGYGLGPKGGFQYEGLFRCPTSNVDKCVVDIWLRPLTVNWNGNIHRNSIVIPNDGGWYYWISDTLGGEDPEVANQRFGLWINNRGRTLDVDDQWVTSNY